MGFENQAADKIARLSCVHFFFFLDRDMKLLPIWPGKWFGYRWRIMPEDGPTKADPRCLSGFYYSSIKPTEDLASGLIGPLLICSKETMDQRGNQVGV